MFKGGLWVNCKAQVSAHNHNEAGSTDLMLPAPIKRDCFLLTLLNCLPLIILRATCPVLCLVAQSCPTLQPRGSQPARLCCPWDSPDKNAGVGCHALRQGLFPTQGSKPSLLHCRQVLYHLRYQGSPLKATAQIKNTAAVWNKNKPPVKDDSTQPRMMYHVQIWPDQAQPQFIIQ